MQPQRRRRRKSADSSARSDGHEVDQSFFSTQMRYFKRPMKVLVQLALFLFLAAAAEAQIQVELRFKRLQYVAHEPVVATVKITNLAGRAIDLHDEKGQHWCVLKSMQAKAISSRRLA